MLFISILCVHYPVRQYISSLRVVPDESLVKSDTLRDPPAFFAQRHPRAHAADMQAVGKNASEVSRPF